MNNQTSLPLGERQEKALSLLDIFSKYTAYKHRYQNSYLNWLNSDPILKPESVVRFLCFWYPVSRHQPQILLLCAAAYPDWVDRRTVMDNYLEEDGMLKSYHNPHYELLEDLIAKIGGSFFSDDDAEELMGKFHDTLSLKTPAQASGVTAGIEHPALDISAYFNKVISLCGFPSLLESDPYLTIHVNVEPDHIIWSHSTALRYMNEGKAEEVIHAYQKVMSFWQEFWAMAFAKLDYPH